MPEDKKTINIILKINKRLSKCKQVSNKVIYFVK